MQFAEYAYMETGYQGLHPKQDGYNETKFIDTPEEIIFSKLHDEHYWAKTDTERIICKLEGLEAGTSQNSNQGATTQKEELSQHTVGFETSPEISSSQNSNLRATTQRGYL